MQITEQLNQTHNWLTASIKVAKLMTTVVIAASNQSHRCHIEGHSVRARVIHFSDELLHGSETNL